MHSRSLFGQWGEDQACAYLEQRGFVLVERNYRCRFGEIDIIASKGGKLSFVEVKTRRNTIFGRPAEAVTKTKQRKIHSSALNFLQNAAHHYKYFQFDVIEVLLEDGQTLINHIQQCF